MNDYLTVSEAAQQLGVSENRVRVLCAARKLPDSFKYKGQWQVSAAAVAARKENNQRTHPPRQDRPQFEEPIGWQRLRTNPWVFYPTVAFGVIAAVIGLLAALISAGADVGPATDQWRQIFGIPITRERDNEILIIVATFDRAEEVADARPHNKISNAIRAVANEMNFTQLRVAIIPTILKSEARAEAEALGQRYNASIVIWGEETSVNVTVNFLNRKQPEFTAAEVQINETERTFVSTYTRPEPYSRFINNDLPGQLIFLTLFTLGQSYYVEGKYTEAATIVERAIASLPPTVQLEGVADAHFRLGWLYSIYLQDLPKALAHYNHTIQYNPNFIEAYNNRGTVYCRQQDYKAALADYTKAIMLNPEFAIVYNNRGTVYDGQKNYEAALTDYNQAISLDPTLDEAYSNRGGVHSEQGDYAAALADHNQAVLLDPTDALTYINRGVMYSKQGDYDNAIVDYTQAITLAPELAIAYDYRGGIYFEQDDYRAALADYNQAITFNPKDADAYNSRGIIYAEQKNYKAALTDYTQAITLNPSNANAYYNRGNLYYTQENYNAAFADYTQVITLDPSYASAYKNRGLVYVKLGNPDAGLADISHALELDSSLNSK